ncbi:LysM peptidoglycan-binding domain-containing protein [Fredinandcohnia sp. QZ13]|uniref:LysM peptidoglycan-binding domain-containing protein n=1 Tax=Fredinandcohnia sp. QZ13 TaxID=3073144 RepID=UPI002853634A|nr:LysM peptidoglycan-binding domain-containing protein [Fredinandcohnia sp. QZ13]MDR4887485.1 LysM peptidoglycan-binding domain-containing protein [Fredinandcohnia sp. QZ13]
MGNKKIYMSVTTAAFIAASLYGAGETEAASTYKVQTGDSLWKIAQKHNITVTQLKSLNNLTSDLIFPNQVLHTEINATNTTPSNNTPTTNVKENQNTSPSPSPSPSKATTYTVKSGDTLSGIAAKHKISLSDLMKWNNLNSTLIFPGNVFVVSQATTTEKPTNTTPPKTEQPVNTTPEKTEKPQEEKVQSATVYTVKSGDTLSRIALEYKVTVANLRSWNNLKSDMIYIGQKLTIGDGAKVEAPKVETPPSAISYNVDKLIQVAKSQLGAGYAWGGSSPNGFDCSGFIYYAYKEAGLNTNRYSSEGYHMRSYYVNTPSVGDLVFFQGTYKSGISHMGIYIGNNEFIHASNDGVVVSNVNDSYWKKHFEGFKRFY